MEIKHSSPEIARPVEVHAGKRRWPWIVLIVLGVLIVIGGIVAALYFYGGRLLNNKPSNNQTSQNQSNQSNQTEQGSTATGFSVKTDVAKDELTKLVIGRFAEQSDFGHVKLSTADATDSGLLNETKILTPDSQLEGSFMRVSISPNGQFAALFEGETPKTGGSASSATPKQQLSVINLSSGKSMAIASSTQDPPTLLGREVWTPDSTRIINTRTDDKGVLVNLNVYDVENAHTTNLSPTFAAGEEFDLIPRMATADDLFVEKHGVKGDDPGQLGTLKISGDGTISLDFQKIIDISPASRGYAVSPDGSTIVLAMGSGQGLGSTNVAPFILESLDRSTGEVKQLRKSSSEGYSAPLFLPDGESILYGAASGVWMLNLKTEDRTQLVESSIFDNFGDTGIAVVEPTLISPDGKNVVISVPVDKGLSHELYTLPSDSDTEKFSNLGRVEPVASDETGSVDALGWTN